MVFAARLASFCRSQCWCIGWLPLRPYFLFAALLLRPSELSFWERFPSHHFFGAFVLRMLSIASLSFMLGFSPWGMQVADALASDFSDPFGLPKFISACQTHAKVHLGINSPKACFTQNVCTLWTMRTPTEGNFLIAATCKKSLVQ